MDARPTAEVVEMTMMTMMMMVVVMAGRASLSFVAVTASAPLAAQCLRLNSASGETQVSE